MKPTKRDRKAQREALRREVRELKAQLASTYYFAAKDLAKARDLGASGVVVTLHALGGRELMPPVCIRDGLSDETIAALRADILRSYAAATALSPS